MIKLIAIDMDGTLLTSQKELSNENREALEFAARCGVHVVICTGRCLMGVKPYYKNFNLGQQSYAILNNGCSIHETQQWALLDWVQLTKNDILYLENIRQQFKKAQLTLFDETHFFCLNEKPSQLVIDDAKLVFTTPTELSIEDATSGEFTLFEAMFMAEKEILDEFEHHYKDTLAKQYSVVRSQDYIFEVMPKQTTKASGLAILAKRLGIEKEAIMAIGDGNNDIEMLQYAGVGVAMANASDYVKSFATVITDTNDNHGVAKVIYDYLK